MATKIVWEENGILFVHSGTVTSQEVMEANNRMYGDSRFDFIRYQISDYTDVTENLITLHDAMIVSALDKSSAAWNPTMAIAIVTTDKTFIPIVEAYFEKLRKENWSCGQFKSLNEAYKWINSIID